ncbi:hypothetical protein D3C80_1858630 [compost metagenome]
MRSMNASAALWPEPITAMRMGLPAVHGSLVRLLRYCEWWKTRGSSLKAPKFSGIFGVPPLPTTTERVARLYSRPCLSRVITHRCWTRPACMCGSMRNTSCPYTAWEVKCSAAQRR